MKETCEPRLEGRAKQRNNGMVSACEIQEGTCMMRKRERMGRRSSPSCSAHTRRDG